jgi:alpha-tubulin suppressor-like RCC1 family protein
MALQDDINNFNTSNTAADLLVLAAQTANTTTNRIISVATVNDLPDLNNNTIEPGTVVFVDSIQIPVVAQIGCWTGLDNRELRNDFNNQILYGQGSNSYGNLGDNSITTRTSAVVVNGGFTDWCQVSNAGHTLAVRSNGTAWAWGRAGEGQLGNNCTVNRSSPVSIVGNFTDWCQVEAGSFHSLGLRTNGTLWSWGTGRYTGTNNTSNRSSPIQITNPSQWIKISGGERHGLGISSNGTAWGWGCNRCGQVGNGTVGNCILSPVAVSGGFNNWCEIAAGGYHSLGVRTDGTAWAWGSNTLFSSFESVGQLGDNTTNNRFSPVLVVGGFTDWCQVAAGRFHSLALRTNGTAWAWGNGGSLGDGTTTCRSSPVSVLGGFTDWCRVSTKNSSYSSGGLRTNGTLWTWGTSPVNTSFGLTNWCELSVGSSLMAIRIS